MIRRGRGTRRDVRDHSPERHCENRHQEAACYKAELKCSLLRTTEYLPIRRFSSHARGQFFPKSASSLGQIAEPVQGYNHIIATLNKKILLFTKSSLLESAHFYELFL